jgi:hypothetical protein
VEGKPSNNLYRDRDKDCCYDKYDQAFKQSALGGIDPPKASTAVMVASPMGCACILSQPIF